MQTSSSAPDHARDIVISAGDYRAAIDLKGGGLRLCEYQGKPLTDTYPAGEAPPMKCGALLAPWPNRTTHGVFDYRGTIHELEINEVARGNACHGMLIEQQFAVKEHTDSKVVIGYRLNDDRWPWDFDFVVTYELHPEAGLLMAVTATNNSDEPAPYGLGLHTYLNAHGAPVDECVLRVPAAVRIPVEPERCTPCGAPLPLDENDPTWIRHRLMKGVWLDYPYTQMDVSDKDTIVYELTHGYNGPGVRLETCDRLRWAQVFTADPDHGHSYPGRGRAVAVEPMSCPPDALRSGWDLIHLQPGDSSTLWATISAIPAK